MTCKEFVSKLRELEKHKNCNEKKKKEPLLWPKMESPEGMQRSYLETLLIGGYISRGRPLKPLAQSQTQNYVMPRWCRDIKPQEPTLIVLIVLDLRCGAEDCSPTPELGGFADIDRRVMARIKGRDGPWMYAAASPVWRWIRWHHKHLECLSLQQLILTEVHILSCRGEKKRPPPHPASSAYNRTHFLQ